MNLTFKEYQEKAGETAIYPEVLVLNKNFTYENIGIPSNNVIGNIANFIYPVIGLSGEVGELSEKIKKIIRDNSGIVSDEKKVEIAKEIGDCLWYLSAISKELELDMGQIAQANLDKLASRKARGVISGSGDNR